MNFWQDFRRRRMLRLVGLYIVGAWLAIQVADVFFPAWGIPETALRYLIIAAILGFPLALAFGWVFDITSEGIVRTRKAGSDEAYEASLKSADYAILAALVVVGAAIVAVSVDRIRSEIDAGSSAGALIEQRPNSIAVLPFVNLDPNPDTGYFSDGVTEEILHRLSTLGALHVLGRTSSFAFRDSDQGPAYISESLGVSHILQGSVRRDEDFVRVTAMLVDSDGFQVWSQSFERRLDGIFAIQAEIASTVASAVTNIIVPLEQLPAGRTTTNMEAYSAYLVGKAYSDARTPGWRDAAITQYEKAIELDPGFAPPHARLAEAIAVNRGIGPHTEEALAVAEKALELDPDLAEAHAILGLLHSFYEDYPTGEFHLRRALELDPSLAVAYNWLNFTYGVQGLTDQANATLEQGLAVDPMNPPMIFNLSEEISRRGDFEQAERLLLRLTGLPEPPGAVFAILSGLYNTWGRLADAVAMAKEHARQNVAPTRRGILEPLIVAYAALGMERDADYWLSLVPEDTDNPYQRYQLKLNLLRTRESDSELGAELRQIEHDAGDDRNRYQNILFGVTNLQLRDYGRAAQQLEAGFNQFQRRLQDDTPRDIDIPLLVTSRDLDSEDLWFPIPRLAFAYRQLGRDDDADELLQDLHAALAGGGRRPAADPVSLEDYALSQALMGDMEAAIQTMSAAVDSGWANYYQLVNDPAWADMLELPGFQRLLDGVRARIDDERAAVEAADASHDFRAEIERLFAP